jgi:hypothetical protein
VVTPGSSEVPDPDAVNESAQAIQQNLWLILAGLQAARSAGSLGSGCARITPGGWRAGPQQGGMARWQTVWTFDE